jgi:drug/metabolite transporter (DMT)-like permease
MIRFPLVLLFIAVAFISWGVYGPVLHKGQYAMGEPLSPSSLRPFICVGIAYFLIAVIVPLALLWRKEEKGHWSSSGVVWSFTAGALGAIGALGIIFAFKSRGNPVFVMPLVFGLAPVVNTFVTMWMTRTLKQASAFFLAGVIIVAIGAAGVLAFKPAAKNIAVNEKQGEPITVSVMTYTGSKEITNKWTAANLEELQTDPKLKEAYDHYQAKKRHPSFSQFVTIIACIAVTAICWGSYGPLLHKGQMHMEGSRLRPFICVGLAYFAIAVVVPLLAMTGISEPGEWSFRGTSWSLAAGAAGAIGALGIILAFNHGGNRSWSCL